jgi:ubiquinone biosynthesis protein Coq4
MRGFTVPGQPGAVNVAVAQHDWVHVLSDYGTTPMGEIEASGFLNSTTRTPGAMLGFIGVLALFESGLMPASLIVPTQPGHNLSAPGGIDRLAEAVARGAACNTDLLLDVDFFQHANEPLEEIRARFAIQPKTAKILEIDPVGAMKLPA